MRRTNGLTSPPGSRPGTAACEPAACRSAQACAFGRVQERFRFKAADHSGIVEAGSFPGHLYHE
jgi:hypothetical protein